MVSYLVEGYDAKLDGAKLAQAARRAQLAVEALAREGTVVRFVQAIAIPDDDTCFLLYEASTADAVGEASRRAAIPFDRVVEVQHVGPEDAKRRIEASALDNRAARSRSKEEG